MICPHCIGEMSQMDHGVCPTCSQKCGCSFNPTSSNDYCEYHNPFKQKERDQKAFEEINKAEGAKRISADVDMWHYGDYHKQWAWHAALKWERNRNK